ncbi:hypothetical protein HII31_08981 [Pseudocercospora fuligena]|uniref:Uncharacterized protein n=1 Tax=Pseudocercospora fuligena TaxID=685502 RepID=A0A8H6RBQ8_9PEZI|nr:hypothetical protein HII31_08981 [Pseudocercospora fuligena]
MSEELPRRPAAAAYLHLWMPPPPAPPPSYDQESAPPAYRRYGTNQPQSGSLDPILPTTIYVGMGQNHPRQIRAWLYGFPRLTPISSSSTESQREGSRGCTRFEVVVLITVFVAVVVFGIVSGVLRGMD